MEFPNKVDGNMVLGTGYFPFFLRYIYIITDCHVHSTTFDMIGRVAVASHIELRQRGVSIRAEPAGSADISDNDHLNINPASKVVQKPRVALLKYLQWARGLEWPYGHVPEVQELLDSSDDETLADIIVEGWMDGFPTLLFYGPGWQLVVE